MNRSMRVRPIGYPSSTKARLAISILAAMTVVLAVQLPTAAGSGVAAPNMVYTHDGHQYMVSLAGGPAKLLKIPAQRRGLLGPLSESYEWSSDGRYLVSEGGAFGPPASLWLFSRSGHRLRSLNRCKPFAIQCLLGSVWFPSSGNWASDADRLVDAPPTLTSCSARVCRASGEPIYTVGLHGKVHQLWPHHPIPISGGGINNVIFIGNDPAGLLLLTEVLGGARFTFWNVEDHDVAYQTFGSPGHEWIVRNTVTGGHWSLPFASGSITMSREGRVAGIDHGFVAVRPLRRYGRVHRIARGYAPAWSPDGRWLYYVSRAKLRNIAFKLHVRREILPSCLHRHPPNCHGRIKLHYKWVWQKTSSAVYRVSVYRVQANGLHREKLFSQISYGFADLNPLADNSGVVFSDIPTDLSLWQHRGPGGRVSAGDLKTTQADGQYRKLDIPRWTDRPLLCMAACRQFSREGGGNRVAGLI